jgi:hypothetical protein
MFASWRRPLSPSTVPENWATKLADAIVEAVREFAPQLGTEAVAMLAVDCHPWHGTVALALLTAAEVELDQRLADPAEMAAWRHFEFTRELSSWRPVAELGRQMQAAYDAGDRSQLAEAFQRACATAVSSPQVAAALARLRRAAGLRLSVAHPDDRREFVAPG